MVNLELFTSGILGVLVILLLSQCGIELQEEKKPVDYVNPYMGNISHLLVPTYPTIHLPNSLLRVYPQRKDFTDIELDGLPLIVTSHRGKSAFNLTPFQGNPKEIKPVMALSYDQEKLTPFSYSVYLDDLDIAVNYGISHQSAGYQFEMTQKQPTYFILNSKNGKMNWDGKAVSGYQMIDGKTRVFIYIEPEKSPIKIFALKNGTLSEDKENQGANACLVLKYSDELKQLGFKYGISFIDENQAKANMDREVAGQSLEAIQNKGREIWNEALGKIKVKGGVEDDKAVFYTSLYRCYERPVCISEDGRYFSAFDNKVHQDNGHPFYTDDWIWDSYRAHHPLRTLIDPRREEDILKSFILMAEQMDEFWMPTFPEITGDSRRMNSNHGVATIIDAYRKGLEFDLEKAYEACKGAIMDKTLAPWSGKPAGELSQFYKEHGYIPALRDGEEETIAEVHHFERRQPVAVTLGTAYDQWCLLQIATELGKTEEAEYFKKASYNYRNLFNEQTHFFHPKDKHGKFIEPFDYKFSGGMGARGYYGENNAWIYRWDVQHNIPDLIQLMGGDDAFVNNLDAMFTEPLGRSKYGFYAQLPDHTGNVGQFSMANEPSLHIPYLYNYGGQPWKTQKRLRKLLEEWFRNDVMGVPGDEDGGGLSAFVVFSMMGFYPVTPGMPGYSVGSPVFEEISVDLGNGKTLEIQAENASAQNKYIQSATVNGKALNTHWINHEDIKSGGRINFEMGPKANKSWGVSK